MRINPSGRQPWKNLPPSKWDLVTLGGLVCDLILPISTFPIEAGQYQRALWTRWEAGGSANTLIAAARLGLETCSIGTMGDDAGGHVILGTLEEEGVGLEGVKVSTSQSTPQAVNFVAKSGEHAFAGGGTSGEPIPFQQPWLSIIEKSASMFVTGYCLVPGALEGAENNLAYMQHARSNGSLVCFDLGPKEYWSELIEPALAATDILLSTEEEFYDWTGVDDKFNSARSFLNSGPTMVVTKTGPDGCLVVTEEEQLICPGFAVEVIDTIGAGDAFAAGFVAALIEGKPLYEAAMLANAVGAATVTHMGTGSLLPQRSEIDALLTKGPNRSI